MKMLAALCALCLLTSCAHFDGRRFAAGGETWGASVILDEAGQPASVYIEGAPDQPGIAADGWTLDAGRTGDGRPYLLLERVP